MFGTLTTCGFVALINLSSLCSPSEFDVPYATNTQLQAREAALYDEKVYTLATALYFEERSKKASDECIGAIGYVVLNRVHSRHFPDTVYGVIWQHKQFSFTHDGKPEVMLNKKAKERALRIADQVLRYELENVVGTADHYVNHDISSATWHKGMKFEGRCHNHWFYTR